MARRRFLRRLPVRLCLPRKGEALPGYWAVLLSRAVVSDPAERATVLPIADGIATAFRKLDSLGTRELHSFEAVLTRPASLRAYASPEGIAAPWRKARYQPAGLCFGRTGFAPVGRLLGIS